MRKAFDVPGLVEVVRILQVPGQERQVGCCGVTTPSGGAASDWQSYGGLIPIMARLAIYIGGISVGLLACVFYQGKKRAMRKVPATKAAELLKRAWADHHTIA